MSEEEKKQEERVFDQKLEVEDLDAAAGGYDPNNIGGRDSNFEGCNQPSSLNCVYQTHRPIYGPNGDQFPNCAATVEEGSCCIDNDGCYRAAVVYDGMRTDCGRTWR